MAAAVGLWIVMKTTYGGVGQIMGPDYKDAVIKLLKKNLDDAEGLEIVEWGGPVPGGYGEPTRGTDEGGKPFVRGSVVFRAKNRFGAKERHFVFFYAGDDKVSISSHFPQ